MTRIAEGRANGPLRREWELEDTARGRGVHASLRAGTARGARNLTTSAAGFEFGFVERLTEDFVPAFSGLYAPHWNDGARGTIVGLTRFANRGHIARAVLEATAFQTWEVLQAMEQDSGVNLDTLRVDGGMTDDELLMQFQADIVNRAVVRPTIKETTALGAAFAAGLAVGVFTDLDDLRARWGESRRWLPHMDDAQRQTMLQRWTKAVSRSVDWM